MKIKKLFCLCFVPLVLGSLSGCGSKKTTSSEDVELPSSSEEEEQPPKTNDPIPSDANLPTEIQYYDEPGVQIHYQRTKPGYIEWGLWIWSEGRDGAEYTFNYQDDYGTIAYYPMSLFGNPHTLGFIVKQLFEYAGDGNWKKDYDPDRFIDFDMLTKDEHDVYHVYLVSGKGSIFTNPQKTETMCGVNICQFNTSSLIRIEANNPLKEVIKIQLQTILIDGIVMKFLPLTELNILKHNVMI